MVISPFLLSKFVANGLVLGQSSGLAHMIWTQDPLPLIGCQQKRIKS